MHKKSLYLLTAILIILILFMSCSSETVDVEYVNAISLMTDVFSATPEVATAFEDDFFSDTGIKLHIINMPKDSWQKFIFVTFSSNQLPDIVKCPDSISALVNEEKIISLNKYLENSKDLTSLIQMNPSLVEPYTINNEIYAIGKNNVHTRVLWVRKDLLDEINITLPENMDELNNMLYSLKDLSGNRAPITIVGNISNLNIFASAYGLRCDIFEKNGNYIEPFFQDEFYDFANYIKRLYDDGIIHSTFPDITNYKEVREIFGREEANSIVMWGDTYATLSMFLDKNDVTDYELVPIPAFETENGVFGIEYLPPSEPFAITCDCDNPEIAIKFLEWIYCDEEGIVASTIGVEGLSYEIMNNTYIEKEKWMHCGQGFLPVYNTFDYPYAFTERIQKRIYYLNQIDSYISNYEDILPKKKVTFNNSEYGIIYPELTAKREALFFSYIKGNITYKEMMDEFKDYYSEIDMYSILKELNNE